MSEAAVQERTPDRLGRYRLLATLGRGGMGDVYLAVAEGIEGFSKLLVVKELRRRQDDDELQLAMFMDEARLAARLNHPHIVQTLEVGSDGPRRFIVMEYLEGQSLQRALRRQRQNQRQFPVDVHVGVLASVLDALAYVHGLTGVDGSPLGIVHRDVNPQNVFVTYEGHVKLIDFGIAKTQMASQQTTAGVVKGKILYMAPEQATGRPVDLRTDVFSVGVMLWDALVGRGPWEGKSDIQILYSLMTGVVPRLRDQSPALPPELVEIVDRATSPAPDERYPSAAVMRDELLRQVGPSYLGDHARALGDLVSRAFAEERLELRALVEAQLRAAASTDPQGVVSLTRVRAEYADPTSQPSVASTSYGSSAQLSISLAQPPPNADLVVETRPRRSRAVIAGAIAAAALSGAVAVGALAMWKGHAPAGVPQIAPSSREVGLVTGLPKPPPSPPVAAAHTVHVLVRVLPASARLTIDDVVVSNPYVADLPRDDSTHTLVAEGPMLIGRTRTFKTTSDTELEISLEHAPIPHAASKAPDGREHSRSPPAPAEPSATAEPPPPPPPDRNSAPRSRPPREMDKENPYAP